jgi:fructose-bisphosphate aldolase class II
MEIPMSTVAEYAKLLEIGRPPNIQKLFPHSHALLVSGKVVDRAMRAKGSAMTIAANGRSTFVIRGVLKAAQRAGSAIIIEIARSEGGANAYCPVSLWNMARIVDQMCNEMNITIPVAIHADHYGIKQESDMAGAQIEVPTLFEAGITSIAVDASHMPDDKNLLANIELNSIIPSWAGLETEVGEIKGALGLSTVDDASFLVQGLNAHGICPDWIALNNGTTHGLEDSGQGIQVELTGDIHKALAPYGTSGAQHGTSGNSSERLRAICDKTATTKANVATALQMVSWGVDVNDDGNALSDDDGRFTKLKGEGVTSEMWQEMVAYGDEMGWKGGDYKKLNLPFENKLCGLSNEVRTRMSKRVEEFTYDLLVNVFNAAGTAELACEEIRKAGSHDLGPKVQCIEDPQNWTKEKIIERALTLDSDKGPEGDYDD